MRRRLRWPAPQGRADTPQSARRSCGTATSWRRKRRCIWAGGSTGRTAVKWHYADEGGFTPIAKELPDGALLHIVSDHLGTPKEMFDAKGELVWAADQSDYNLRQFSELRCRSATSFRHTDVLHLKS